MADKNKRGFRTVKDADMKEYKRQIREHRLEVMRRSAVFFAALLLLVGGIGLYMAFRQYTDYDVRSSVERADAAGTQFADFQGNVLKYSNDGAFYTDAQNELIWNQTYEMTNPEIDICEGYLVIYDRRGTKLYILTPDKLQGSIETTMQIEQVCVASQGTVAILMRKDDTSYIEIYDKEGKKLAGGELHGEKGGYPIAIALSHDAIKLGVSMLDISEGSAKSTIAFYNYGSVGQNEIDNCVGVVTYEDIVIPELEFTSNNTMIAIGDSRLYVFEGTQKPQQTAEIILEKQARSIFHNEEYVGVISNNDGEMNSFHMWIYKVNGDLVKQKDIEGECDSIHFMSNNEICVLNETSCDLYTLYGVHKFHYTFEDGIYQVIPGGSSLNYTFVLKQATERVRLK